jgi:serine/threonine protein kinase
MREYFVLFVNVASWGRRVGIAICAVDGATMDLRTLQALASGQLTSLEAKYRKVKILGRGSFGTVWLVREKYPEAQGASRPTPLATAGRGRTSTSAGRTSSASTASSDFVAKEITLTARSTAGAQQRELAAKEVRVLSQLYHANVVRYVEQVTEEDKMFIVMEYCHGGDLKAFLQKRRADGVFLKENEVLSMFRQLLRGVAYLHEQHMMHRDIKTANIFLTKSGRLKLGDFGLSKDDLGANGVANTVCGTPMYYSPELCRQVPYNFKADVWALGCVFYEIMALSHPYEGLPMRDMVKKIIALDYADPNPGRRYNVDVGTVVCQFMLCPASARLGAAQLLKLPILLRHGEDIRAEEEQLVKPNATGITVAEAPQRKDTKLRAKPAKPSPQAAVGAAAAANGSPPKGGVDAAFAGREARLHRLLFEARNSIVATVREAGERRKKLEECDRLIAIVKNHGVDDQGAALENSTQRLLAAEQAVVLLGDRCSEEVFQDLCVAVGVTKRAS